jgi:[ribosomal protein S18]-alanine N-acetyltransferase
VPEPRSLGGAVALRDATQQDLGSIRQFLRAYVEEFWNRPFPRPEFNPDYLTTGKVVLAEEGGEVIGMAKGVLDRGCGHVSFIYVRPSERGHGAGRALLLALCDWFTDNRVVGVTLGVDTSNPAGLAWWERLGFREFHRELTTPLEALKEQLALEHDG